MDEHIFLRKNVSVHYERTAAAGVALSLIPTLHSNVHALLFNNNLDPLYLDCFTTTHRSDAYRLVTNREVVSDRNCL